MLSKRRSEVVALLTQVFTFGSKKATGHNPGEAALHVACPPLTALSFAILVTMTHTKLTNTHGLCFGLFFFASLSCQAGGVADLALVIKPNEVTANDVNTISLPSKRPKKMSIRSPSNEWYVVHETSENMYLLPKKSTSKITSARKKISEIIGVKWVDGKRVVEPVFKAPGEYMFYMADNLETEPDNTFHLMSTVTFRK